MKRIKWNIEIYPMMTHYIVAPNMKFFKAETILSPDMTRRIVRNLMK